MSKTSTMKEQQMGLPSNHTIDEQHVELLPPRTLMQGIDLSSLPVIGGLLGGGGADDVGPED